MIANIIGTLLEKIPESNRLERIWKLAQVDFKERYYNDRLGLLWALIKPAFEVCIYFFFFKKVFRVQTENYALFLFSGLIVYGVFSEATSRGMRLLSQKLYLLDTVQLSKIDLFTSYILSVFIGFSFNLTAFILIGLLTGNIFSMNVFWMIPIMMAVAFISMGTALMLSCIQPFIKDLHHAWEMVLMLGTFSSGIFFEAKVMYVDMPYVRYLNPFVGIVENVHGALLYNFQLDINTLSYSIIFSTFWLLLGIWVFSLWSPLAIEKL